MEKHKTYILSTFTTIKMPAKFVLPSAHDRIAKAWIVTSQKPLLAFHFAMLFVRYMGVWSKQSCGTQLIGGTKAMVKHLVKEIEGNRNV